MKICHKIIILTIITVSLNVTAILAATPDIHVQVNGKAAQFDVPPVNINGRVFVSIGSVMEMLDASVVWDGDQKSVTVHRSGVTLYLQIDNTAMRVKNDNENNEYVVNMDVAPVVKNGRTMLPISFVVEPLGADVEWEDETKTIYINDSHNTVSNNMEINSAQSNHYAEYPDIPDFAKYVSADLVNKVETAFGHKYVYDSEDFTSEETENYIAAMEKNGYLYNAAARDYFSRYYSLTMNTFCDALIFDGEEYAVQIVFNIYKNRITLDILNVDTDTYMRAMSSNFPSVSSQTAWIGREYTLENSFIFSITDTQITELNGDKYWDVKLSIASTGLGIFKKIDLTDEEIYMEMSVGEEEVSSESEHTTVTTSRMERVSVDSILYGSETYTLPFEMDANKKYDIVARFKLEPNVERVAFVLANKMNGRFVGMPRALFYDIAADEYN